MQTVASEYTESLYRNLPKELKSIPKPYFISTLFPEEALMVCRPLMSPFDKFAITHTGIVFCYKPLNIIRTQFGNRIHSQNLCIPKYRHNDSRPIVVLEALGIHRRFFIHRLILDRFYNVDLNEKIEVVYVDGDETNVHVGNLEAYFKNISTYRRAPDYEYDRHEWCPVH